MKIVKILLLLCIGGLVLFSQSKPKTSQIQAPITSATKLVGILNGRLVFINVGTGLSIVDNTLVSSLTFSEYQLNRQSDNTWGPITCSNFSVFRNGLRQLRTVDYSVIANSIRFMDGSEDPSENDDVVIIECK